MKPNRRRRGVGEKREGTNLNAEVPLPLTNVFPTLIPLAVIAL